MNFVTKLNTPKVPAPARSSGKPISRSPAARVYFLGILVAVGLLLSGCCLPRWRGSSGADIVAARQLSQQGTRALQTGRIGEAEKAFSAAVKRCPHDPQIRERFGDFLLSQGRAEEALEQYLSACRLAVDDPHPRVKAAEIAFARGQFQLAESLVTEAINVQPHLQRAWVLYGRVLATTGRADKAVAVYSRAIAMAPDDHEAQLELARLFRQQGEPYKALAALQTVKSAYLPDEAPAPVLLELAMVYSQIGRTQEAQEALLAAKKVDPKNPIYDQYLAAFGADRATGLIAASGSASSGSADRRLWAPPLLNNGDQRPGPGPSFIR